jgi:hypothetical protein
MAETDAMTRFMVMPATVPTRSAGVDSLFSLSRGSWQ